MKKTRLQYLAGRAWLTVALGASALLGFITEPAHANHLAFYRTIYGTDFASAGVGALRDSGNGTINLTGVTGTVTRAYLYWAGPMNTLNPTANSVITVNTQTIAGVNIGMSQDNCWGFLVGQAYRADVTEIVKARRNGAYSLKGLIKPGVNVNGASLLVFFNDGRTNNNRDIVLFDGNDSNAPSARDDDGWNVTLGDINYRGGRVRMHLHVSDGQTYSDEALIVNGVTIYPKGSVFSGNTVPGANAGPGGLGRLWDIRTFDVNSFMTSGPNTLQMTHAYSLGDDCTDLIVAAIDLPAGSAPVIPNQPPTVNCPASLTISNAEPASFRASVTDPDGDALTFEIAFDGVVVRTGQIAQARQVLADGLLTTGTLNATNAFPRGMHVVTFTVSDGKASASAGMAVEVVDITPPTISYPSNMVVNTDPGKATALVNYIVTATDDFPGVSLVCLPPPGSAFKLGTTAVNCTAVDAAGNRATGSFTITVVDREPPVLICPSNVVKSIEAGTSAIVTYPAPGATDNCPGVRAACMPPSGSTFNLGTTPVVCVASDTSGNKARCEFSVTVLDNRLFIPSTNVIRHTDPGLCSAVVRYPFDNLPPGQVTICNPPDGSIFPKGVTTVRCTATSVAGRTTNSSFTVAVVDRELPKLICPTNIIASCSDHKDKDKDDDDDKNKCDGKDDDAKKSKHKNDKHRVKWTVSATDNCPGVSVVCVPPSGSIFSNGVTTVRCTATDASGNVATCSFEVRHLDLEPPVFISLKASPVYLWPANHKMVEVKLEAKTSDNCGKVTTRVVAVSSSEPVLSGSHGDVGPDWQITGAMKLNLRAERLGSVPRIYTLTVEAKDEAGNVTTKKVLVKVEKKHSSSSSDKDTTDKTTDKTTTHKTTTKAPTKPPVK